MVKLIALACLAAWSIQGATYYIDYTAGSDTAAGTSKTAPWKRAPGMKGFAGSYTHAAGDRFIFKGGATWPASCYQWKITTSGTAEASPDYYGVDQTWFAGSAFTSPQFDFGHVAINGWTLGAGVLIQGGNYNLFDGLEFKNHRTPLAQDGIGTWGCATITFDSATGNTLTNCIVRDWDQPTMVTGTSGGGGVIRVNSGDNRVKNCLLHQDNIAQKSGTALWNMAEVAHCEVRNTPTAIMYSGWSAEGIHHNHIHHLPDPADAAAHSNAMLVPGGRRIHSNLIHDTTARAQVIFVHAGYYGAEITRVYNNIAYALAQPALAVDSDGVNNQGAHTYAWNNSFEGAYSGSGHCVYSGVRNNGPIPHLELRNNHFISQSPISIAPAVTVYVHANNVTNTQAIAAGLGYTQANHYAPIDGTKPTVGAGADLSASFTVDYDGTPRSVPWDIGAHEWAGVVDPQPGTIVFGSAGQSVSEEAGTAEISVHRTGGTSGAVGVSYATADGTAAAGLNFAAAAGQLTWPDGDGTDRTIEVTLHDLDVAGNMVFNVALSLATGGATLGSPALHAVTLLGTGAPPVTVQPGLGPWVAIAAEISPPFSTNGGFVSQSIETINPDLGGRAVFRFIAPSTGQYKVRTLVRGEDDGHNSFSVAMNAGAVDIWDVVELTTGFQERYVSLRGSGNYAAPEFPLAVWSLTGGTTNTFTVYGREASTALQEIEIELINPAPDPVPVVSVSCTNASACYGPNAELAIVVTMAAPVTVTGTPELALNSGETATYAGGSGTANLVFAYQVADGTSEDLDYLGTNALTGDIAVEGVPCNLVLPAPGGPGSISYGRDIVVDTTPPTVTISAPSLAVTSQAEVSFTVTFSDSHFGAAALTADGVTLTVTPLADQAEATASATVTVSGTPGPVQTVTLRDLSGDGVMRISIAPGVAADLAGNATAAAGPSLPVTVRSETVLYIQGIGSQQLIVQ